MKTIAVLALCLALRLALACGAWAQAPETAARHAPPGLEIGATVGAIWFTPTIGLLASLPAAGRTSIEGAVTRTPHVRLLQAQARLPVGHGSGARRSVIAGLTHIARTRAGGALQTGLAAHAGMSAQAPVSRHVDLRTDLQMIVPMRDGPDADLRALVAVVWRR